PSPNVPCAEMVCHAGRNSERRAAFPSEKETNLVCPGVAQQRRQRWQSPAGATPAPSLAHARHVGTAPIIRASASTAAFSALAHVSPFHYHHRLHGSCVTKYAVAEYAVARCSGRGERHMDRNRSYSSDPNHGVDAENPEGQRYHLTW